MKISNIALMLFCLVGLTGCPMPALYRVHDADASGKGVFKGDGYELTIKTSSPWLDHQKKVVIIEAGLKNTGNGDAVFKYTDVLLGAATDTFLMNRTRTDLNNKHFINDKDTALIKQGEQRDIYFYFLSGKDYSRSEYNKSIERDTLRLRIAGMSKEMRLVGERH